MNTLLAYIEGDATYKVLSMTSDIFDSSLLDFSHNCSYTEGAELDEDEWFKIDDFVSKPYCLPILNEDIASTQFNQLPEDKYASITYLIAIQDDGNLFCFQRITSQNVLKRNILQIRQSPAIYKMEKAILLDNVPHAVYKKDTGCLFFKRLSTITSVFLGIDSLYREASKDEAMAFMSQPFMASEGQIEQGKISSANLKRLHSASEKLSKLTEKQQKTILEYIHKYKKDIPFDSATGRFRITNNTDLQYFLWGIDERYYSTITQRKKRVARSIITL